MNKGIPRLGVLLHNGSDLADQLGDRGVLSVCQLVLLGSLPGLAHKHPGVRSHSTVHQSIVLANEGDLQCSPPTDVKDSVLRRKKKICTKKELNLLKSGLINEDGVDLLLRGNHDAISGCTR